MPPDAQETSNHSPVTLHDLTETLVCLYVLRQDGGGWRGQALDSQRL